MANFKELKLRIYIIYHLQFNIYQMYVEIR